ncbi:MAG: tetratricopeptide repeat protein [Bacteroidetes bacterium]|jgi:tetratricopeptide (TPR) repeat protein|nr:tetratricopeptide repeat protein [Bacteroidota bacterium]
MKPIVLLACILGMGLLACSDKTGPEARVEQLRERLAENRERQAAGKAQPDSLAMMQLARALEALVAQRPGTAQAPQQLMEAAALYHSGLGDYSRAFTLYNSLAEKYPKAKDRPEAIIRMAGIAQVEMKNPELALKLYKAYLAEYPDGAHAQVCKQAIIFLEDQGTPGNPEGSEALPEAVQEAIRKARAR